MLIHEDWDNRPHWFLRGSTSRRLKALNDKVFPQCQPVANPTIGPEVYTRSLSMLGHGVPLWDPLGSTNSSRQRKHLKTGVNIGDVGFMTARDGDFLYYFNIFASATDEIQIECPTDFEPLPPLAPENVLKSERYFAPGTAFFSKGVSVTRLCESPLDIKFNVEARESGILLLPDGASREDLVSTDLIREFVGKNALAWYTFINEYSHPLCTNGSLCIITGVDKSATYALANSSPNTLKFSPEPTVRWRDGEWEEEGPHQGLFQTVSHIKPFCGSGPCAVIIRGMQVALGGADWIKYVFRNENPWRFPYYYMLSTPITGRRARLRTVLEKRFDLEDKMSRDGYPPSQAMFNPSLVILQFLIKECPNARVAITEDILWCSLIERNEPDEHTIHQFSQFLRKFLEEHEVSEKEGLVTLVPWRRRTKGSEAASPSSPVPHNPKSPMTHKLNSLSNSLREECRTKRRCWEIATKLASIFPGEGLPRNMLE